MGTITEEKVFQIVMEALEGPGMSGVKGTIIGISTGSIYHRARNEGFLMCRSTISRRLKSLVKKGRIAGYSSTGSNMFCKSKKDIPWWGQPLDQ